MIKVKAFVRASYPKSEDKNLPLIVDVDGTLIHTDLLYEAVLSLIRKNPLQFIRCLLLLFKSKALFKEQIFQHTDLDFERLPYNQELLEFLKKEKYKGRNLMLATASPISAAQEISKVHPLFDEVFGTLNNINLKGANKRNILVSRFGRGNFDYIGNSNSDTVIFSVSRYSYLVNPGTSLTKKVQRVSFIKKIWQSKKATLKDYCKELRLYQWVKNILIFVPLLTSHSFYSINSIMLTSGAFIAFGLLASSGYLINDIFDINSDRNHPKKFQRPVASGKISIPNAIFLSVFLFASGALIAVNISDTFFYTGISYYLISVSYSLFFKKLALYDVFLLACLYSIRVFAGSVAIQVSLSFWLFAFSAFIFLSLAFLKRYTEMITIGDQQTLKKQNRGYSYEDTSSLQIMGIISSFLAIIVFALYINSPDVMKLYANPSRLWFICFLLLFWISHIWLKTSRGKMTNDPIVFALKDTTSYIILILSLLIVYTSL